MIITIAGMPGAGKSTVKRLLSDKLHLHSYSIGDLRGEMARERNMTIDEFNAIGLEDPSTDQDVDRYQKQLGETEDNFIIDGLLSWFFIPQSFKVFLSIHPDAAAKRIFKARTSEPGRDDEPKYQSIQEAKRAIAQRITANTARYQKWYRINPLDPSQYDLVIDTTNLTPEEVVERILAAAS